MWGWMIEGGRGSRLPEEPRTPDLVRSAAQQFDRDGALKLGVVARYTTPIPPAPSFASMR